MDVFTPIILACLADGSACLSFNNNQIYKSLEQCEEVLANGLNDVIVKGWIPVAYDCHMFSPGKKTQEKDEVPA